MKKFIFIFVLSLIVFPCFADVSFEILSKDIDDNGNIRIWTIHKIDGVEVPSNYPKMKDKDGVEHFVYCTRYTKQNFKDCVDKTAVQQKILDDIQNYSNNLIRNAFDKNSSKTSNQILIDYNTAANQSFSTFNLDDFIGKKVTTTSSPLKIDIDNDGISDKEIDLKTDGTKTEQVIMQDIAQ
jgi:hypothetical protein